MGMYPEIPPKVEYSMTELGMTLLPIVKMMYDWGKNLKTITVNKNNKVVYTKVLGLKFLWTKS
jgi:DNA-binding HxlR family transcriptional regulator